MSDLTTTFRVFFPSSSFRASGLAAALAFFVCLIAAPSASALTYTVTTNADSGAGSLRQAVLDANGTAAADVIVFNIPPVSCPAGVCTITLASEIIITNNGSLSINGTGANVLTIDGGAGTNRIFFSDAAIFNLSGVTLTSGNGTGGSFNGSGGALIVVNGTTTISGVYFNANSASEGGGILFLLGANHRVENSTFSGNTVTINGGGIQVTSANLTVVNTTLSGNSASSVGGGINASGSGTLTLRGDTITANTASQGGGVSRGGTGTLDFGNTIIAGNTATTSFPEINFASGTVTSSGFNLVGDSAGDASATGTAITYQSTDIQNTPPLLDTLANYGGTTPTRRLQTGSPAIDKGSSFTLTTDQRGFARPFDNPGITNATGGDGADIGAFEVQQVSYEADVSPRPSGDGSILPDDVVQVRRFQNTTDVADQTTDEFQRADSSPFASRGDGKILSDDVVQTRRYQNGTDPKQPVGGPMTASLARTAVDTLIAKLANTTYENALLGGNPREVRVESTTASAGQMVTVNIRVNAVGNESEYGFIISYDSSVLSMPVIGAGTAGASVRSCNIATAGTINCSVGGFPNNNPTSSDPGIGEIAAGNNQLLITVTFTVAANATPGATLLTLSNVNASSDMPQLFTPTATNGTVTILAPTAAAGEISGRVVTADGRGVFKARLTLTDRNGEEKTALTNSFGYYRFNEVAVGETYVIAVQHKRYVFVPQVINVNENIGELIITANR